MGSSERRERERQALQTQILDATRAILSERGYDGLTMRAVADRVEYSVAALYKHFADREELVRALCACDFQGFAQALSARPGTLLDDRADPMERLRAIGRSYAEFAISHPEQYRVMFMAPVPVEAIALAYGDPEQDAYALVAHAVQLALDAGHFPGLDKDLVTQTMWAAVHGVVSLEIAHLPAKKRHIPFADLEVRVAMALDGILLGLSALAKQRTEQPSSLPARRSASAKPAKRAAARAATKSGGRATSKRSVTR